ncbi:MAG TPA: hypothetical protein VGF14_02050 [Alphaproteobacteria bacterium]
MAETGRIFGLDDMASTTGISQLHQMTSVLSATSAATALPTSPSDVMLDADVEASCNPQVVTSSAQSIAITCGGGAQ